jgi:hypothetical protein
MFVGLGALKRAMPDQFAQMMKAVYPMVEAVEKGAPKPSPEQLWQAGKVWMGPEGKGPAMGEIPDWMAGLGPAATPNPYGGGLIGSPKPGEFLGRFLTHPTLYKGYPGGTHPGGPYSRLSDVELGPQVAGVQAVGTYLPNEDRILLASQSPQDMLESVLHETQHAIAARSGLPQGTSYRAFLPGNYSEQLQAVVDSGTKLHADLRAAGLDPHAAIGAVRSKYPHMNAATLSSVDAAGLRPRIMQYLTTSKHVGELEDAAKRKYFLHPGELIPKAMEMRMNLPPEELARQSPDETIREFVRALR